MDSLVVKKHKLEQDLSEVNSEIEKQMQSNHKHNLHLTVNYIDKTILTQCTCDKHPSREELHELVIDPQFTIIPF